MLERIGHFLFRTRNVLLPLAFAGLLVTAPPRPFGHVAWDVVAAVGLAAIAAGQALRVVCIGLDYVKRGGRGGRIDADRLVTGGVYAHGRNPMYLGNLLILLGLLALAGRLEAILLGGALFIFAYAAIVASEESFLRRRFGDEYARYCAAVPRWRVRLGGLGRTIANYRFDWRAVVVKEYGTLFAAAIMVTGLLAWKSLRGGTLDRAWPWLTGAAAAEIVLYAVARLLKKRAGLSPRGPRPAPHALGRRRRRIDAIDASILRLLNRRAEEVAAVFEIKRLKGIDRVDAGRMEQVLARLERINRGPLSAGDVRRLYGDLLTFFSSSYVPGGIEPAPRPPVSAPVEPRSSRAARAGVRRAGWIAS